MARVACEYCDSRLLAPLSMVGRRAPCPACGHITRIMPMHLRPPGDVPGTSFREDLHIDCH
jgi:hypothetical protein